MSDIYNQIKELLADPMFSAGFRILIILVIALPFLYLVSALVRRRVQQRFSQQSAMLAGKAISYGGFLLVLVVVLNELGFQLGALLGAAGIAGIAIGLAAQSSLSNVISGAFLISEKAISVGDLVKVGDDMGFVLSIDLLSVKIRAFDNRFIRIPNEDLVKSRLMNFSHFAIRRIDIEVGVAYREDPQRVMDVLSDIAKNYPLCLDEPEPLILFKEFADSSLNFLFGIWCVRTDFLEVKNNIMMLIKRRFDEEDIEIPFPHRTVYTGSRTDPMPLRVVNEWPSDEMAHGQQS